MGFKGLGFREVRRLFDSVFPVAGAPWVSSGFLGHAFLHGDCLVMNTKTKSCPLQSLKATLIDPFKGTLTVILLDHFKGTLKGTLLVSGPSIRSIKLQTLNPINPKPYKP